MTINVPPDLEPSRTRADSFWVVLLGLGLGLLALELAGLHEYLQGNLLHLIFYLLVTSALTALIVWVVWRRRTSTRKTLGVILVFALLFRLLLIPLSELPLSSDMYRYVWDGRVQGAGISPYLYVPEDPVLASLRDDKIYPNINRRDYAHTIYPPFAQVFFWAVSSATQSVSGFKLAMALCDFATIGFLLACLHRLQQPLERVVVYAWHPLPIWEFCASGHLDALMILCVVVAIWLRLRNQPGLTGVALACATLVKFFPLVLVPAFYQTQRGERASSKLIRSWDLRFPLAFLVTVILFYLPYTLNAGSKVLGFLPEYAKEEGLRNGDGYYLFTLLGIVTDSLNLDVELSPRIYNIGLAVLFSFLFIRAFVTVHLSGKSNRSNPIWLREAFLLALTCAALVSSKYAWYYAWIIPFLCFIESVPALYLSLAAFYLYRMVVQNTADDYARFRSAYFIPFFVLWLVYAICRIWQNRSERTMHPEIE
jgi:alpha-1,6-mannosyltransferase